MQSNRKKALTVENNFVAVPCSGWNFRMERYYRQFSNTKYCTVK